eukprot:2390143-Lingulodinium_polyedra.AAC.1
MRQQQQGPHCLVSRATKGAGSVLAVFGAPPSPADAEQPFALPVRCADAEALVVFGEFAPLAMDEYRLAMLL